MDSLSQKDYFIILPVHYLPVSKLHFVKLNQCTIDQHYPRSMNILFSGYFGLVRVLSLVFKYLYFVYMVIIF